MRDSRYVLTWVLGIVLIFPTLPTQAGNAVPVLIWGGETSISPPILVNPLQKTSQAEFEKIVTKKVGGSQRPVLVFVRDNLCVEDFTQHKEVRRLSIKLSHAQFNSIRITTSSNGSDYIADAAHRISSCLFIFDALHKLFRGSCT